MKNNIHDYLKEKYNFQESELNYILARVEELNHSLQRVKEFNSEQELDLSSPSEFYNE
ncbi:MAG: hypothetical protein VX359_04105 [Chloroflexota bacterium]|jgi:hypothetical protein